MMSKNKDSWLDEPLNKFLDYHIEGWEVIESVRTKAKHQILQAIKEKIPKELDEDGSTGKWVNGYNDCLKDIKKNLGIE